MVHQAQPRRPSTWAERARQASEAFNGAEHLTTEAVVAFVDAELSPGAHERAAGHVARCAACAEEVSAQRQARAAVRSAAPPCVPASLLGALRGIPQEASDSPSALLSATPGAPLAGGLIAGAVVQDATGRWVAVLRPEVFGRGGPTAR